MFATNFELTQELLRRYLLEACGEGPSEETSSEGHALWQYPAKLLSVTLTRLSEATTLVVFVVGKSTVTTQVDLNALGIDLPCSEVLSADSHKFAAHMHSVLGDDLFRDRGPTPSQARDPGPPPGFHPRKSDVKPVLPLAAGSQPSGHGRPSDMPYFEDELQTRRRLPAATPVYNIGEDDLNGPVPPHPELRPYLDPLAPRPSGGLYLSPDHPMFGRSEGNTSRLGVPPGARFDDPYGENNLEDMGLGLPGNLRRYPGSGPPGFNPPGFNPPGYGSGGGFGGGFGGSSGGGFHGL